jgi:hypothetical protein
MSSLLPSHRSRETGVGSRDHPFFTALFLQCMQRYIILPRIVHGVGYFYAMRRGSLPIVDGEDGMLGERVVFA